MLHSCYRHNTAMSQVCRYILVKGTKHMQTFILSYLTSFSCVPNRDKILYNYNLTILEYNVIYCALSFVFSKVGKMFNKFRIVITLLNTSRAISTQNTSRYTIIYDIPLLAYTGCATFAGTYTIFWLASLGTGGWTLYQSAISCAICFRER